LSEAGGMTGESGDPAKAPEPARASLRGTRRDTPGIQRRVSRLVDIAEAVSVHVSTVSRVLNGDPAQSIRPEI